MALTLIAGVSTTNTPYTTSNGNFNYSANVQKAAASFQSVNGSISKNGVASAVEQNVGNFNKYMNNPTSYNFDNALTTEEKQSLIADIDDMINQLTA